jgi:hypothetical protein
MWQGLASATPKFCQLYLIICWHSQKLHLKCFCVHGYLCWTYLKKFQPPLLLPPINSGALGRRRTHNNPWLGALLPYQCASTSLSSLSLSCGIPKGLRRSEIYPTTARCHATGIPDPIQTDLLPQALLDRSPGGHRQSSYVYKYYEVLHMWHWSHCIRIYTTLRSDTSTSLSTLVWSVIPAFGLQWHVTESQLIITALLIDRS